MIGDHAVHIYGRTRTTEDLDIFVNPSDKNAQKLFRTIDTYGFDLSELKDYLNINSKPFKEFILSRENSLPTHSGTIELLGRISGIKSYDDAKQSRAEIEVEGIRFFIISKEDLIKNKIASGREKDLKDAKHLSGTLPKNSIRNPSFLLAFSF